MTIQGVKIEGTATILSDPAAMGQAAQTYMAKFPPNPDLIFIKVEPVTG
jgi:hypothetical protein